MFIYTNKPIYTMKRFLLSLIAISFISVCSFAQIPTGYYDDANGLSGAQLKTALRNIIDNHDDLTYSELWTAFQETDVKSNGKVWDMYSDVPGGTPAYEFTFISDQCGSYSSEGDCYNREHSFPKSWFNDGYPMYTDMFHLVPTDGYVNGQRGNFPFGEVGTASWTSTNGSKKGSCSYPGYSGTVFEPIDEYKGDFARGYFYMATRYESSISSWSSPMLAGNSFPAFTEWAINLLMDWHEQDPVSQKEIDRNNKIYEDYQHNRNPFIDHPEYVNLIWGDETPTVSFTSTPATGIMAGELYTYNVTTTGGNGNPINITCTQKPEWLSFTGGTNGSATLSGTPSESDEGVHSILLSATDGESSDEQSFTITVEVTPTSLVFTSTPITSASVNQQYSYTVEAVVEGDELAVVSFEGVTIPDWLNFTDQSNGSAILYGTPTDLDLGSHSVQLTAISGDLETSQSFAILVSSGGSGGEFVETFELIPESSTSYASREWTGDNGFQWSATNARTDQVIVDRAICLKDLADSYLLSQTLTGGVSSISFDHQQMFSGLGGEIALYVNDQQVGDPVLVTTTAGEASFSNINVSGEFTIKLVSNGLTRIAIDNLAWTNLSTPPQSPVFGEITHTPTNPTTVDQTITLSAVVTDPDGTVELVKLLFGNNSSNLDQNLTMIITGEDIYSVSTSLPLHLGDVYYKIEATDNEGNTSISPQFMITAPAVQYTLEVIIVGEGSVTVNGNPYTSQITANEGSVLNLSASPDQGYLFEGWTGDLSSSQSSESITLTSNMIVTATFVAEPQFPVIVDVYHTPNSPLANESVSIIAEVTDADGTVDEVVFRYGNTSGAYVQSLEMSLSSEDVYSVSSVLPLDQGAVYYIVEATDNDNNTSTSSEYTIVAATPQYELEISILGEGEVTVNGDLYSESILLDEGSVVSLVATPSEGYQFDGWSGDLTSNQTSESVTMVGDKLIVATFSVISSIDQNSVEERKVYPNPFGNRLSIDNSELISRISFINVLGQNALVITNPSDEIGTGSLPKGLYLIAIEDFNGNVIFRKVMKE